MSDYSIIETMPGTKDYAVFEKLPSLLYPINSPRFILGHDPVSHHLVGCLVLLKNKIPVGRCALYLNKELLIDNKTTACVGSYECEDDSATSSRLLKEAQKYVRQRGAAIMVGPMEGSTWETYRFSLHNDQPNFFMEPYHQDYYPQQWVAAGFNIMAKYYSNLDMLLEYDEQQMVALEKEYVENGATVRSLDMNNIEDELYKIGKLSVEGFQNNLLYTPMSVLDFVEKYKKLTSYFDPRLIWMIEDESGDLQAFIFAIKDHLDAKGKTIIIKSMVRKEDSPYKGIGRLLSQKVNQMATEMGCDKAIHALMISDNASRKISEKMEGAAYKEYALYRLDL